MLEESTQIFIMRKFQKKVFNVLSVILTDSVHREDIILKCFQKNVNILLKKKRFQCMLLMAQKFVTKKILLKKIQMNRTVMEKILIKNFDYRLYLDFIITVFHFICIPFIQFLYSFPYFFIYIIYIIFIKVLK